MNYALNLSIKVEDAMLSRLQQHMITEKTELINQYQEEQIYQDALAQVLQENPRAQLEGDIRIGEIILIVDSDTRVVRKIYCLLKSETLTVPDILTAEL